MKPAATKASRAADLTRVTRAMAEVTAASRGMPLDLSALIAPYEQHDRLSLRIERLPPLARLSKGQNNNDRTWSLTPDDLDGLLYMPPKGMDEAHTLGLRIISVDWDHAATLAVLEVPIAARDASGAAARSPADPADAAELARLQDELAAARAALSQRDTELAKTRQAVEQARAESAAQIDTKLTTARSAWEAELDARLGEAARGFETSRAAWQAAHETSVAEAKERAKADAAARLAAAEVQWREQSGRALVEATARIERTDAALAAARAEAEGLRERSDVALRRLHDELVATQTALADRETKLTATLREIEQAHTEGTRRTVDAELTAARTAWQAELDTRLAEAAAAAATNLERSRAAWQAAHEKGVAEAHERAKADDTVRLAALEAQWREHSGRALAEATARFDGELGRLRNELAATQAALAERETKLAALQRELEHARGEDWKRSLDAELAAARTAWQAELDGRLAEAAAKAAATLETSRVAWQAEQDQRIAALTERAKSDEAGQLAALDARWREQAGRGLADATARFERAEAALAEARAEAASLRAGSDGELRRVREELATTQAALAARETALAAAQRMVEQAHGAGTSEAVAAELSAARAAWTAELEARLAEAATKAAAQLEHGRAAWQAEQESRLAQLSAQAQERIKQAQARGRQEAAAALVKAEEAWRAGEAARLAVAEEQWRERSGQALADALTRVERAEAALAQARAQSNATPLSPDQLEFRRMHEELATTQAALATRATELAEARTAAEQLRQRWAAETQAALRKAQERWKTEEAQRLQAAREEWQKDVRSSDTRNAVTLALRQDKRTQVARRLIGAGALAASVAVAAVLFPVVAPAALDWAKPKIGMLTSAVGPLFGKNAAAPLSQPEPVAQVAQVAQAAERRAVIGVPVANVRAAPSTTSAVVTTLARDTDVTPVEWRGSWVLIRIGGEDGSRAQQGWVYASFLKTTTGG